MGTADDLLLSSFVMTTAAVRVLVRTGVLPKDVLLDEITSMKGRLAEIEMFGAAADVAADAVRDMQSPSD